jgi:hypothetical protein
MLLTLTRDGRVQDEAVMGRVLEAARSATDCFVFCHGWLHDEVEARQEGARFFALLDGALLPLRDRVLPLRVVLHWPSKPVADQPGESIAEGLLSALRQVPAALSCALARQLCEAEVTEAPEEEAELDGLRRALRAQAGANMLALAPTEGLSFWLMKKRAGQVGARFGRDYLSVLTGSVRTHLIGHSFGGKLAAAAILAGGRPESLTLLLSAFSAFAFAAEVPGFGRPGAYHPVVAEQRVARSIAVLRSDHDQALHRLYRFAAGGAEVAGLAGISQKTRPREVVATSAIGAVGARAVGAPELTLDEVQRVGLPRHPIVNVDGSAIVKAREPVVGAHRDIHHAEVATLILLAGGLLEVGPEGIRPPRLEATARR